jgi:hypothetical protein
VLDTVGRLGKMDDEASLDRFQPRRNWEMSDEESLISLDELRNWSAAGKQ